MRVRVEVNNEDKKTVESFGDEWLRFDQSKLPDSELKAIFLDYFSLFPFNHLSMTSEGFDMGCGSGRWAKVIAPLVGRLHCIDPSNAIEVARANLSNYQNIVFHRASVNNVCLPPASQDFGYSLGVLHHVPDTVLALSKCVSLLKPGAPFLLYLYYAFDNRPLWYKIVWKVSDLIRRAIVFLPPTLKNFLTDLIAFFIYFPLARGSNFLEKFGIPVKNIPLSYYRNCSFYTMRTDSRDRLGTPLEKRFTRAEILSMLTTAGLTNIAFSSQEPYWCVLGYKAERPKNKTICVA